MGRNLNELVLRTIEFYNRYRSPEETAKLVSLEKDGFVIEFKGAFCLSCRVKDYFETFIFELEDLSRKFRVEIIETQQTGPQSFKVYYVVKGSFSESELDEEALFHKFLQERGLSFTNYLTSNACTKEVFKFHFRTWRFERKPKLK